MLQLFCQIIIISFFHLSFSIQGKPRGQVKKEKQEKEAKKGRSGC